MNMPFHFYGTYTAAVAEGIPQADALVIANAAQFVDECSEKCLDELKKQYNDFYSFYPTYNSIGELLKKNFDLFNAEVPKDIAKVWTSFHFLPGNLTPEGNLRLKPHNPEMFEKNISLAYQKIMCLPYSFMVGEMIDRARIVYNDNLSKMDEKLTAVGIAMHVMADTFAHEYFVGAPSKEVNDVGKVNEYIDYAEEKGEYKWITKRNIKELNFWAPAFTASSIGWLGHGRIGTLPDQPGLRYSYCPNWETDCMYYKDNPLHHLEAFTQMRRAIRYIIGKTNDDNFNYSEDMSKKEFDDNLNRDVFKIFDENKSTDEAQTDAWRKFFSTHDKIGNPVHNLNGLKADREFITAFLYNAQRHLGIVSEYCDRQVGNVLNDYS